MNNKFLSKLFIFLMTVTIVTGKAYAEAQADQTVLTSDPPTVSITKLPESNESATLNIENNGAIDGEAMFASFLLQVNGTDSDYDFIVTSTAQVEGGTVSAYGKNGSCIVFTNIDKLPTEAMVSDAKIGGNNNPNAIAFPVNVSIPTMNVSYQENYNTYGDCFVVLVGNSQEATLRHDIGTAPYGNTYHKTLDTAGTYQATITFTAFGKQ